jgi:hypothetical protein
MQGVAIDPHWVWGQNILLVVGCQELLLPGVEPPEREPAHVPSPTNKVEIGA